MGDNIRVSDFIEKLKQTRIREIDTDTLASYVVGWCTGIEDILYEERGWQILLVPSIPSARVSYNWVEQDYIETEMADKVLEDIATVPPPIKFKQPIDTEGTMIYNHTVKAHIKATNEFPAVKRQFRNNLSNGFDLRICTCQISYNILAPLTHWIETPTFLDPLVEWYFDTQGDISVEIDNCTTKECVEDSLDEFWSNMKKLNTQLPNVKTPVLYISSPVTLSVKVQEFLGEWVTVGENVKNVTIKICEEGETYIKFYSVKHPDWEGRERTEVLNVVGEISYFFDVNIPKRITIKSVPIGAKITVVKKG